MKPSKAAAFLENMKIGQEPVEAKPQLASQDTAPAKAQVPPTRRGLKHIGGYLDPDTVEKVAILRARLSLDNSQLITLAINELHNKHKAKRAFSDL